MRWSAPSRSAFLLASICMYYYGYNSIRLDHYLCIYSTIPMIPFAFRNSLLGIHAQNTNIHEKVWAPKPRPNDDFIPFMFRVCNQTRNNCSSKLLWVLHQADLSMSCTCEWVDCIGAASWQSDFLDFPPCGILANRQCT